MNRRQETTTRNDEHHPHRELSRLIEEHFEKAAEDEDQGHPVAPVSASDKLHWANKAGVNLQEVDQRLNAMCDPVIRPSRFSAVDRYRLRAGQR